MHLQHPWLQEITVPATMPEQDSEPRGDRPALLTTVPTRFMFTCQLVGRVRNS